MAFTQINPVEDKPKPSKLETALKYGGLAMDMAGSAGKIGGMIGSRPTGNPAIGLRSGAPSSPMGSASLLKPEERLRYMKMLGSY